MKTQFTLRLPCVYFRFEKFNMGKGEIILTIDFPPQDTNPFNLREVGGGEVYFSPSVQR